MDIATSPHEPADGAATPGPMTAAAAVSRGSSSRRWLRGSPADPAWARPASYGLLALTAILYLTNLTANGYANSFYSAAAQAGSQSWRALLFGALDAPGFITVDKPPASLWFMALSVRTFGLNSFAILLPEVLMGVASVGVLYATVKRHSGATAGLLAGVILALTPVAVLMFRFNNPEALLVLCMVLGAWATMRAVENNSWRWIVALGVFMGLGFLTKTLQVLLVVPGFALAYLVAATGSLRARIAHLLVAALAMVLSAGWWVALVELVPATSRPYIGGSQTNSFLELTFGYNGLGRLNGDETGSVTAGGPQLARWGSAGWSRMFGSDIGGQISWLLPAAVILLVAGLVARGRRPHDDARRAAYLLWGSWLLVTAGTFSFMAGIFHQYYTVALAPAVAALVAMGATELWERRHHLVSVLALSATVAVTAIWSYLVLSRVSGWLPWLRHAVLVLGIAGALALLVVLRRPRWFAVSTVGLSVAASLAGPLAYSLATVARPSSGSIVMAGPAQGEGRRADGAAGAFGRTDGMVGPRGGMGGLLDARAPSTDVVSALSTDADSYTWVAAAVGAQSASALQLATGQPVMAIGGFNGSDPAPTLAQFQQYATEGRIHYFVSGGGFGGRQNGGSRAASDISTWVQATFSPITIGAMTFYDLTSARTR